MTVSVLVHQSVNKISNKALDRFDQNYQKPINGCTLHTALNIENVKTAIKQSVTDNICCGSS